MKEKDRMKNTEKILISKEIHDENRYINFINLCIV